MTHAFPIYLPEIDRAFIKCLENGDDSDIKHIIEYGYKFDLNANYISYIVYPETSNMFNYIYANPKWPIQNIVKLSQNLLEYLLLAKRCFKIMNILALICVGTSIDIFKIIIHLNPNYVGLNLLNMDISWEKTLLDTLISGKCYYWASWSTAICIDLALSQKIQILLDVEAKYNSKYRQHDTIKKYWDNRTAAILNSTNLPIVLVNIIIEYGIIRHENFDDLD